MTMLDQLQFNEQGLIPAIAQAEGSGEVLMMAWMNRESIEESLKTGYVHYWSRSRNKLWKKGGESGHLQRLVTLRADCDMDCLLLTVRQTGPACHTNRPNCFFHEASGDGWRIIAEPLA